MSEIGLEVEAVAIGGSHDRETIKATPYGGQWARFIGKRGIPPVPSFPYSGTAHSDVVYTEVYRLETIRYSLSNVIGLGERWFWVHESLTNDDAFVKIIEGYGK